jgi:hypothetical protein
MTPTPSRKTRRPRATPSRGPSIATQRFPTHNARIEWLFDFLRTDFTTLPKTQVQRLQTDVIEFVQVGPTGAIFTSAPRPLTRPALERLATSVQNGILALETGQRWELDGPIRTALVRWGETITTSYTHGTLTTLFLAAAMAVVQDVWSTLHRCPQCTALFRKVGKQRYCSVECSRQYRWQKFSKKGRTRDYRREREQAAERKYGPNIRVGRRTSTLQR